MQIWNHERESQRTWRDKSQTCSSIAKNESQLRRYGGASLWSKRRSESLKKSSRRSQSSSCKNWSRRIWRSSKNSTFTKTLTNQHIHDITTLRISFVSTSQQLRFIFTSGTISQRKINASLYIEICISACMPNPLFNHLTEQTISNHNTQRHSKINDIHEQSIIIGSDVSEVRSWRM